MADILTHLRELSFGYGILKGKGTDFKDTPADFLNFCKENIKNTTDLTVKNISSLKSKFNENELQAITNGLKLSEYVLTKDILDNKNLKVKWVGPETQSGTVADIYVGKIPFSLKEESFILHNMGLYQLINILIDTVRYKRGLHIFEEFSPNELNEWFIETRNLMIEMLQEGTFQIKDKNNRNIKLSYSKSADKLYLFFFDNEENIYEFSTCEYKKFLKDTTGKYREKVFAKFINKKLSSNARYLEKKKQCSEMAGKNFKIFLEDKIKSVPSPKSLFNLFRIEKKEYYYAKATSTTVELYKIPSQSDFTSQVKITNVDYSIPTSQLNILTTIENIRTEKKLVFRNELRYSHGQFNGTPEAKMYIDQGDLLIAYEEV